MHRRRLLAMLPLASVAMLAPPSAPVEAAPEPIDPRPTFSLADYRIFDPDKSYVCDMHGVDHHAYTHGCQPVAFTPGRHWPADDPHFRPVTADAIPVDVYQGCPFSRDLSAAHQHHDFRWVD